ATTYVHKHLKVGDKVNINGPYGDFYYQEDSDKEMVLVAVGTGIAPIISILNHMKENNIERKATFYIGAKTPDDLVMVDYYKDLEESLYDIKFIPTLSRVTEEHNWSGDEGRVTNALDQYLLDCGNKEA